MSRNKLIVILGPTSSGKTELSIKLAKKFNGEVVSADSRQVYKGMDIGTGKITKKEMEGIPHYILSVANPKTRFTVAQYQKLALKAIKNIHDKGKTRAFSALSARPSTKIKNFSAPIPFLVGGTGFYIQSVTDGIIIPEVKPDWKLRKKLEVKPIPELYDMLVKLDYARAKSIDKNNPRRVIRAIEIVLKTKAPIPPLTSKGADFEVLFLGVKKDKDELKKIIEKRLLKRLSAGMIKEVKKLKKSGLSWNRLEEFGLEYRFVAQYLQNKITYLEMINNIQKESEKFAKRQMTWFKRDKRIRWIKNYKEAEGLIRKLLK